jgi:hypothetical protein
MKISGSVIVLAVVFYTIAVQTCYVTPALAQGPDTLWTRTHGGTSSDYGYSVQQTPDGGYIIVGSTFSFGAGSYDIYVVKADADGEAEWARTYGGTGTDHGRSIQQTLDGGYIIAGYTNSSGAGGYDVLLIKTDSTGTEDWGYTYGGASDERALSVQQTLPDSGYVVAGWTETYGAGSRDAFVVKVDAGGGLDWGKPYGGTGFEEAWCIRQTLPDSGYVLVGTTDSWGAGMDDVYLVKTDADGDTIWTRTYGGLNGDYGYQVLETPPDSGYVIVGNTYSFGSGDSDVYLIKTDARGDSVWTRTFGGIAGDFGYGLAMTSPQAGYMIAGSTRSFGAGSYDAYVIRADDVGSALWTRTYGGAAYDDGFSVQQTAPDSGYIVVGSTRSFGAGIYDMYVLKSEPVLAGTMPARPVHAFLSVISAGPNPFKFETAILYRLAERYRVDVDVYDVLGRRVAALLHDEQNIGLHTAVWDGRSTSGSRVASGIYYLRIEAAGQSHCRKVLLLR